MNRIFISFAIEDANLRDLLKGQAKNNNSPFEFVDMSVKEAWSNEWKTKCRSRIKGCDGVISIVTSNTAQASGQIWEMRCAKDERIPIVGIYGYKNRSGIIPSECGYIRIMDWSWSNIASWMRML